MLWTRSKSIHVPPSVLNLCHHLQTNGYQTYVVGGAVRDAVRGEEPTDWDVTSDALPDQIEQLFRKTIPTGKKYGTITVLIDSTPIEVTTMRKDAPYSDGRRPDTVTYTSDITLDLGRRDFTINAIAYDPLLQRFVDPYNGRKDVRRRLLRTVGNPVARFNEDALRMLRFLRFSATLNYRLDNQAIQALNPALLVHVAWERIRDELSKLLLATNFIPAMQLCYTSGIMNIILPELTSCAGVYQGNRHKWDVLGHSLMCAQAIEPQLPLRLAALLHDIGKPSTTSIDQKGIHFYNHDQIGTQLAKTCLQRLKYSNEMQRKVDTLVRWHMFPIHPQSTDKAIRRFIAKCGSEHIEDLIQLRKADILAMHHNPKQAWQYYQAMTNRIREITAYEQPLSVRELAIDGEDLLQHFSLTPGPLIGATLNHLLEIVLEDPSSNTASILIDAATSYIAKHKSNS